MENPISKLNPYELEAVLKWVDGYALSRSSRKLCRDFSDSVLLAEILKLEFPKLVDIHNYIACSSISGKIKNWDALNRKVLRKFFNISLKTEEIEKLASAEKHFIEQLLFSIMNKIKHIKAYEEIQAKKGVGDNNNMSSDIITVTITKQVGDHLEHIPQQMIPYAIYEDLVEKYEQSQINMQELNEKNNDLRNALQSKIQIIADLEERIEKRRKKSSQTLSINSIKESFANLF